MSYAVYVSLCHSLWHRLWSVGVGYAIAAMDHRLAAVESGGEPEVPRCERRRRPGGARASLDETGPLPLTGSEAAGAGGRLRRCAVPRAPRGSSSWSQ